MRQASDPAQPMQMRGVMMNHETAVCSGSVLDVAMGTTRHVPTGGAMLLHQDAAPLP